MIYTVLILSRSGREELKKQGQLPCPVDIRSDERWEQPDIQHSPAQSAPAFRQDRDSVILKFALLLFCEYAKTTVITVRLGRLIRASAYADTLIDQRRRCAV